MQRHQFLSQDAELSEELRAGGHGHSWEVDLQELGIALAVGGGVEDGVDVVEDVLRAEGGGQVAVAVGDEFEAEAGGEGGDEIGVEVGDAAIFNWIFRCGFRFRKLILPA